MIVKVWQVFALSVFFVPVMGCGDDESETHVSTGPDVACELGDRQFDLKFKVQGRVFVEVYEKDVLVFHQVMEGGEDFSEAIHQVSQSGCPLTIKILNLAKDEEATGVMSWAGARLVMGDFSDNNVLAQALEDEYEFSIPGDEAVTFVVQFYASD